MTSIDEIRQDIEKISRKHRIDAPRSFLFWFLKCDFYLRDDEIKSKICDAANDKTVDAIHIDNHYEIVYVVQSKYKLDWQNSKIKKNDLTLFGDVQRYFETENARNSVFENANIAARSLLHEAFQKVRAGYRLQMLFITNALNNETAVQEFMETEELQSLDFKVFYRDRLIGLWGKYRQGAVPPIPHEVISVIAGQQFPRTDKSLGVQAYVFTMSSSELSRLYKEHHERLFERNVREFLRSTKVNSSIRTTLTTQSEVSWFWYYHNGITFLADEAQFISDDLGNRIEAENPQIVNGLQSTRVISSVKPAKAELIGRLIVLKQTENNYERIQNIIRATNNQNPVSQADLMSNDARQVELQRALDTVGYFYERKQNELANTPKTLVEKQGYWVFNKVTLARAMIATIYDPSRAKGGKDKLFTSPFYEKAFAYEHSLDDYLLRWWLHECVRARAKKGDRASKQAVLHVFSILFELIGGTIRRGKQQRFLIELLERKEGNIRQLNHVIDILFECAKSLLEIEMTSDPDIDANYLYKTDGTKKKLAELLKVKKKLRAKIGVELKSLKQELLST